MQLPEKYKENFKNYLSFLNCKECNLNVTRVEGWRLAYTINEGLCDHCSVEILQF
jgi:hypothetical protein